MVIDVWLEKGGREQKISVVALNDGFSSIQKAVSSLRRTNKNLVGWTILEGGLVDIRE